MLTKGIVLHNISEEQARYCLLHQSIIEAKFGLQISAQHKPCEYDDLLQMLNEIYSSFPKGLIKEITTYYKNCGIKTYVKFLNKESMVSGSFYFNGKEIILYYYPQSKDQFGEWVIGHELGHLVHKYLNDLHGSEKLKNEWINLNNGLKYGIKNWTSQHKQYFVRKYSLTNYAEDFATVVELLSEISVTGYQCNLVGKNCSALKKKIDLLLNTLLTHSKSFRKLKSNRDKEYLMLRMAMQ